MQDSEDAWLIYQTDPLFVQHPKKAATEKSMVEEMAFGCIWGLEMAIYVLKAGPRLGK